MGQTAFLFPGQGSQSAGMGKELAEAFPEAKLVFEEVDDALNQKLSRLAFEGPQDELTLTENAQPAIMACSLAVLKVIEKQGGKQLPDLCAYVAGHSLGEYSALCAAGTFSLSDTARLLKLRGQAMQKAVKPGEGAMAALLGAELEQALAIAKEAEAGGDVCEVANDNAPGQVVISGSAIGVDKAIEIAKAQGIKRAVKLAVSAPFHSSLMQPAAVAMKDALQKTAMQRPSVTLIANVTAEATQDPEAIRALLVEQVTGRVRWRESILTLQKLGVSRVVEIGAGNVLAGMMKRIAPEITAVSVHTPKDIEALLETA
ncbi:MAG: ACP S-malonyltransferase [Alphaproteobacteria bacterium]|nr:ACP S-malonyltransferase [Alphaproteobacteria bacterium]